MKNPYVDLPNKSFWRRSVGQVSADDVDPVEEPPFAIRTEHKVATAGSCFAQHISRMLVREGFQYLVTEPETYEVSGVAQGAFSARYGNIYTIRQLLQLFNRAYGLFVPSEEPWQRADGKFVDPFRPRIQEAGYSSIDAVSAARKNHFSAVREMFEQCDIFIFTLGLTEGWISSVDGAVFPLAPGVAGEGSDSDRYQFENFAVDGMVADLICFIDKLRVVNPQCRLILTVSPVPLIATYENRHVLVSNTYSKSALRVVAEVASRSRENVSYFPSFEIITGAHQRSRFYEEDLREVTPAGVAHVMSLFKKHYLSERNSSKTDEVHQKLSAPGPKFKVQPPKNAIIQENDQDIAARLAELNGVICDEEALDPIVKVLGGA